MKPFYVSTAIDYTNGAPHLGHAYEKVLADAIARWVRLTGRPVYFLTGLDQHGQKVQQTAEKAGIHPATHVKKISKLFVQLWQKLGLSHDAWIETTDERHKKGVQALLQKLHDDGQLYKATYKGYYSVRQEQYVTDKERQPDGTFGPEWGEVVELEEENWYFRLKQHIPWLRQFLKDNPDAVFPESRYRNLLQAVEDNDGADLCISRPKSRLRWGIELPFDTEFVCYVWFDALTNYITGAGWPQGRWNADGPDFYELWPNDCNIIGKDILVPAHGVYWMTMLHAGGFTDEQMPHFLVHGWWNIRNKAGESEKMSKSVGNVVDPAVLVERFGADAVRYYLLSDMTTGQDADFSLERLVVRNNSELANGLGNLLNRSLNMTQRYTDGVVKIAPFESIVWPANPSGVGAKELLMNISSNVRRLWQSCDTALQPNLHKSSEPCREPWRFNRLIDEINRVVRLCNQTIDETEPFKLHKEAGMKDAVSAILHHLCEALVHVSVFLEPVCPQAAQKMREQLRWEMPADFTLAQAKWGLLADGHQIGKPKPLFPKIELEAPPEGE